MATNKLHKNLEARNINIHGKCKICLKYTGLWISVYQIFSNRSAWEFQENYVLKRYYC